MILVAYIHGYNLNLFFRDESGQPLAEWLIFLENAVSDGLCRVAVPLFFAISGYLAALKLKEPDFLSHWQMIKKKWQSLAIPYLLVSLGGILLVVVLLLIPWSKPYFNHFSLSAPITQWLNVWILSPVPFQLWFIRFLWLYFLMFPLLYFGVQYGKWLFMLFLIWFWSDHAWQNELNMHKMEVEGMLFFCLGIFIAIHKIPVEFRVRPWLLIVAFALWTAWIAWRTAILIQPQKDHYVVHYNILGITFTGLFLCWIAYDYLPESLRNSEWLRKNAPYSIGVFLLHEPALTILKKLMIKGIGMNDLSLFVSYITAPALAFAGALFISKKLHQSIPGFYNLITGNRAPGNS